MHKALFAIVSLAISAVTAHAAALQTVTLDVQNMTCAVCPLTVKKSLERVAGVSDVRVDFKAKTARVTVDLDQAKPTDLIAATTNAGYPSTLHTQGRQ